MSTQQHNLSPTPANPGPNGDAVATPANEAREENPEQEYAPEDFSQLAINRGQRRINYELTEVDEKLANAIDALKAALAQVPNFNAVHLHAVDDALTDVRNTIREVAGIIPPGCQGS